MPKLLDHVAACDKFELLVPLMCRSTQAIRKQLASIPPEEFTPRWAGFATTKRPYTMQRGRSGSYYQYVQRNGGERPEDWRYQGLLVVND